MATREIALFEDGKEYYRGKLGVNECYFRGRVFKDVQRPTGKGPTKFTITVSNGKEKDSDKWRPSTFVHCIAWGEDGEKIAGRYADKDEIELIAKYTYRDYNGKSYTNFVVREVIRMKPESADNPYPQGDKPTYAEKNTGDFEEIPSDDSLPF